jgi:hypothetical protein
MFKSKIYITQIKTMLCIVFICVAFIGSAQKTYKRSYPLQNNYFKHVAFFSSGNAIMYVDRDSLLGYLMYIVEFSDYYESSKQKIGYTIDTMLVLSKMSDITDVTYLTGDPETLGIILSYYSNCIMNKKANVLDKRTNKYVKKIVVKKSSRSSRSFSSFAWYYYFLPNDKKEFMHRLEKSGTGIKFL